MLRVMIVDDEPVIRFGIKASIDWEIEGLQVIGDFANGAAALDRMKSEPADILITDIKMPVMDGLALTREALKLNPRCKVILVSSHNDFEYVREGLKLGVVDYILKYSLEPEELLAVLKKCKELISEEDRLRTKLQGTGKDEFVRKRKGYELELKRYLIHKTEWIGQDRYPEWLEGPYAAVTVKLNRVYALEENYGFMHKSIVLDQFIDVFYGKLPQGIALSTAENEMFFLMPAGEAMDRQLSEIRNELEREGGVSVTIGYDLGTGSGTVKACFLHSQDACERGFFEGEGIFRYGGPAIRRLDGCHLPSALQADTGDERLDEVLERWKQDWSTGGIPPAGLKEEACRVVSMMFKRSADPYALVESFDRLFKAGSLDELCALLKEQIAELRKHAEGSGGSFASHHPVDKALEFIRAHYLEAVTLQQVADAVHVSKNYFSILFKKSTGQNFIDYVIHLRIQKAKELLSGTDLKIYEIAEQSGVGDVKYFSKLFKKICGVSPVDFREQHRSDRNDPKRGEQPG